MYIHIVMYIHESLCVDMWLHCVIFHSIFRIARSYSVWYPVYT